MPLSSKNRGSSERKAQFLLLHAQFKKNWIWDYLTNFTEGASPKQVVGTYFLLLNISRRKNAIAPSDDVLNNLREMVNNIVRSSLVV